MSATPGHTAVSTRRSDASRSSTPPTSLFAERGYDDVSIEDIARAAGVTRGLVHHYFGGRNDVYVALIERIGSSPGA